MTNASRILRPEPLVPLLLPLNSLHRLGTTSDPGAVVVGSGIQGDGSLIFSCSLSIVIIVETSDKVLLPVMLLAESTLCT